ncbi:hypothetical protein [Rhodobacter ferrooxidans]|nr:hypothetical protein [Rhodobacter sp. SW2]
MIRVSRSHLAGLALTLVLLIATAATGFAHRALPSPDDIARASHALFWGEPLADLCDPTDSDGTAVAFGDCPACHLVGAAVLPGLGGADLGLGLTFTLVVALTTVATPVWRARDAAHPVRAPPRA